MDEFFDKVKKTVAYHINNLRVSIRQCRSHLLPPLLREPIFVVGCSRGGTTLVYKTFSQAKELGTLQKESHAIWADLHPLSERNWSSHGIPATLACEQDRRSISRVFFNYTGNTRIVDKNNQNGLSVPYLHALFPDAYFVFVKRSAGDNINSLIEGWKKADQFATWSEDIPEKVRVDSGKYTQWCFFLADRWRNFVNAPIEDVCAFQYRSMNEAIVKAKLEITADRWVEIKYEDILMDPVGEFQRAFQKCGLTFGKQLEKHCSTVLENPYNAFSEVSLDKWKTGKNRDRIEKVLPHLQDLAKQMGYGSCN